MSRVDDDRQDQRIEQARLLQKQQADAKSRDLKAQDSAFAKKMATTQTEQGVAGKQSADAKQSTMSAYESLLDNMGSAEQAQSSKENQKDSLGKSVLKQATSAFQEKIKQSRSGEGERMGESRAASTDAQTQINEGRAEDARDAEHTSEGRSSDAKTQRDEAKKSAGQGAFAGRAGGEEKLKTGADGGGGKGSGGDSGGNSDPSAAGFRFNPALMAPVPVAKPKDNSSSERVRKIAQEIAQ